MRYHRQTIGETPSSLRAELRVDTLKQQLERAYAQYSDRQSDIAKNSFLQSLKCKQWYL